MIIYKYVIGSLYTNYVYVFNDVVKDYKMACRGKKILKFSLVPPAS